MLFVHGGVSYGRFVLFITDGKHYVSTLFEVRSFLSSLSNPFLVLEELCVERKIQNQRLKVSDITVVIFLTKCVKPEDTGLIGVHYIILCGPPELNMCTVFSLGSPTLTSHLVY